MLRLENLALHHFKNYKNAVLAFSEQVNCFAGKNGSGKTNLLDAIYYLSFTKSHFNTQDQVNIQHEAMDMSLEANYDRTGLSEKVRLYIKKGDKKTLKVNYNDVKKFSDHIGQYPLVMITPNDIMIILEGSEERRKFLDGMISQMDKTYLMNLMSYQRTVEQRNRQLKQLAEQNILDITLLESYNDQLVNYGEQIHEKRKTFLASFIPVFRAYYQTISSSNELVNIHYESDLNTQSFTDLLNRFEPSDLAAMRTTRGIHKDELAFSIDGHPLKKFGSQGQQKSFIISLKLAQYAYLKEQTGTKPLLLLDDIFEKLDGERLQKLLNMIAHDDFGQIFITDTHINRLKEVFAPMEQIRIKYFSVEHGTIHEL